MNYWLICTTPNMVGASDLFLIRENTIPDKLKEEMINNDRKMWHNFSLESQKLLLTLEEINENTINLDSDNYDQEKHKIVKILKYYLNPVK